MNYDKLEKTLIKAKEAAIEASKGEDGGTANMDTVTIRLPRASEKKIQSIAGRVGLHINKIDWFGVRYFVYPPACGQGNSRVRATEAMQKIFKEAGYETLMFSMMD